MCSASFCNELIVPIYSSVRFCFKVKNEQLKLPCFIFNNALMFLLWNNETAP